MNDKILSIVITAQDKASAALNNVTSKLDHLGSSTKANMGTAEESTGRFESSLGVLGSRVRFVAETFAIYGVAREIATFTSSSVSAAAQLQQTNMAFQTLIGNVQVANNVFSQLVKYANVTPFQTKDIAQAAQTLMGFGTAGQQTVDIIKELGDIVSVTGGDLNALSLVTGQIFSQGKLRAQDMYQVINDGGAAVIKIMARNVGGMQNLTAEFDKGGVPAEQYFAAVQEAVSKGGFAFEGAKKQADTFNGRLSTLKDSVTQLGMRLLGVTISPDLGYSVQKGGVFDRLTNALSTVTNFVNNGVMPALSSVASAFDTVRAAVVNTYNFLAGLFGPSLESLFNALETRLIPSLVHLYNSLQPGLTKVLEVLAVIVGTVLYAALWLGINALNVLISVIGFVINTISNAIGWVGNFAGAVINMVAAVVGVVGRLTADVSRAVSGVYNALVSPFERAWHDIENIIGNIEHAIGEVTGSVGKIGGGVTSVLHTLHIPGFATGGYTGSGSSTEVAGFVHKGEYVLPKSAVDQQTGQPKANGSTFNMYGSINLGSADAVDQFFKRLDAQREMSAMGIGV